MPSTVHTVLITGGGGTLARATAAAFAAAGWRVHAPGRNALDVNDPASVAAFVGALDSLDLLIPCAGLSEDRAFPALDAATWDAVLGANLRGAFLPFHAALPLLVRSRGAALFIGSRVGRRGAAGQSAYAAAKAGLIALAQTAAREHGADGVRVNVVLPGFLETRMTAAVPPARRAAVLAEEALGRFNTPEETARFLVFLAGMPHTSGQVFQLDSRIDPWI